MLNYYKRNYPREPYTEDTSAPVVKTQMSVLMFHGLGDTALLSGALNNTWDWMGKDLTLVTIPGAGHFVQKDRVGGSGVANDAGVVIAIELLRRQPARPAVLLKAND